MEKDALTEPKLIRVNEETVILDARECQVSDDAVAEVINRSLGFETVGSQLETRKPGEGLYIGPAPQAFIARMASINPRIFVGSKNTLQPS